MACFIAPTTAAIVATGIKKKIPAKYHFEWLVMLFWGGSIMLIIDHLISGELAPYPPFLTTNPAKILPEILIIGGSMTMSTVIVWIIMILTSNIFKKENKKALA